MTLNEQLNKHRLDAIKSAMNTRSIPAMVKALVNFLRVYYFIPEAENFRTFYVLRGAGLSRVEGLYGKLLAPRVVNGYPSREGYFELTPLGLALKTELEKQGVTILILTNYGCGFSLENAELQYGIRFGWDYTTDEGEDEPEA